MARSIAFMALVAMTTAKDCGFGEDVDDCCVCNPGWTELYGTSCSACAPGYVMNERGTECSSGRKGATCSDSGEYPYFGCSYQGQQIGKCAAGAGFPCDCSASYDNCEHAVSVLSRSACYPSGARIYSTFPNQPIVGKPFALTILGCDISVTDRFVVIPAFSQDLTQENTCAMLATNSTAGFEKCTFTGEEAAVLGGGEGNSCNSTDGLLLTGLTAANVNQSLTQLTYKRLTIDSGAFRGTDIERATASASSTGIDERETYFRVCMLKKDITRQVGVKDGYESMWVEVAGHDHVVEKRDYMFKVSKEKLWDPLGAADLGAADEGDECCDGLKVGSLCLDLWIFLLLWLLMACCLGAMGYTLHKNKNEIEAQKNNERYEQFNVDDEMSAMAAKQAEDDDDI